MAFDYEIVAHAEKADAVNKRVKSDLVGIEGQADKTGKAIGAAFGSKQLQDAEGRFIGTAAASQRMRQNVDALTSSWEREDAVLERIKGPAREYEADLKALTTLQEHGAISSKEYAAELEKMGRKHGAGEKHEGGGFAVEGSIGKAFASQGGEVGNIASALASGAAVEATALAAVGVEAVRLGSEYIELSNHALRLADSDAEVTQVIDKQLAMSKDLHGSLEQTMELSTVVRERTEDLNLTQRQQADFAREVAQAVQLSGHAMGDSAGAVNRLAFALDEGVPAGKQLKQVFLEFPEIAKVMQEQTGKTAKELIEMGNKGQFSMRLLVDSLHGADTEMSEKFGKRTETIGQQWQHFKDDIVVSIGKFVESTGVITVLGDALHLLGKALGLLIKPFELLRDGLNYLEDEFGTFGTVIKDAVLGPITMITHPFGVLGDILGSTSDKFNILVPKTHDASEAFKILTDAARGIKPHAQTMNQVFENTLIELEKINRQAAESGHQLRDTVGDAATSLSKSFVELNDAMATLGITMDKWGTVTKGGAGLAMEHAAAVGEAKRSLSALNDQVKFGGIGALEYQQKYRSLLDTIEGGRSAFRTIFYEINDPMVAFDRNLAANRDLFDAGRISVMQYGNELEKLRKSDPYFAQLEQQLKRDNTLYDELASAEKKYREMREHGISSPASTGIENISARALEMNRQAELDLAAAKAEDVREGERVNAQEKKNLDIVNLRLGLLKQLATPAEKLSDDINQINKAFVEGSGGSQADYDRLMADLKTKFVDTSPEEKYKRALNDLDEASKLLSLSSEEIATAQLKLKREFGQPFTLNEGIDSGLQKIKKEMMDVGSVAETFLVNAFHGIENAIVDVTTKGSADWSKMVQSMESDLARLAIRELEMKLVGSLFGGAELPGHDMGASWVVPGSGGADTSLQAFWASPGETVTVTPTGSSSRSAPSYGGGYGGPMSLHLHLNDDPRALPVAMQSGAGRRATFANIARSPAALRRILR